MLSDTCPQTSSVVGYTGTHQKSAILDKAISRTRTQLVNLQNKEGYWIFELEADCTIPSEYILMMHFMDEINLELQTKIANFLRSQQSNKGSYLLYKGGLSDLSGTIKSAHCRC